MISKKLIPWGFLASALLMLSACNPNSKEQLSKEDFTNVVINDEYSFDLPDYMKTASGLNDDASLQYQNAIKETYAIVIDEDKEEIKSIFGMLGNYVDSLSPIENYRSIQLAMLGEAMEITKQSEPKKIQTKSSPAEVVEINATVEGIDEEIFYMVGFMESKSKLYMTMTWTLASRQEKYHDTFVQIMRSFKEI